jgi:hypothetical protein
MDTTNTQRAIKFRFWNPPGKSFVQLYKYSGYVDELFEQDSMLIPSQYTGLIDDFGNEIWEGDIIELKRKDREGLHKAEIQFVEGAYLAKFIKHEGTLSFFWLPHLNDYCEVKVIGNKFANTELT